MNWPEVISEEGITLLETTWCKWEIQAWRESDLYNAKISIIHTSPFRFPWMYGCTYDELRAAIRNMIANPWNILVDKFRAESIYELIQTSSLQEEHAFELLKAVYDGQWWSMNTKRLIADELALKFPTVVSNYLTARALL